MYGRNREEREKVFFKKGIKIYYVQVTIPHKECKHYVLQMGATKNEIANTKINQNKIFTFHHN